MTDLRFPIGPFESKAEYSADEIVELIDRIETLPAELGLAVAELTDDQLDTRYRPEGWTVRQVVHHLPDSHANAYVRFKLALTEDEPRIRTYREERWAELADARSNPEISLALLDSLHVRWVVLLRALAADDLARRLVHPDHGRMTLAQTIAMYAWHGRHHVAHITSLRDRRGWS